MNRDEVLKSIRANVQNPNLVKHMLAAEAVMVALARKFGEDESEWGLAGLLHDIDIELIAGDMNRHSRMGAEMARKLGASKAVAHAILSHNETHGVKPESRMDKALFCVDPLTGLITAAALIRPDKSLAPLEARSVRKRFKEKSFAAGASREQIARCADIGLDLDEFMAVGLQAMQDVARDLGL